MSRSAATTDAARLVAAGEEAFGRGDTDAAVDALWAALAAQPEPAVRAQALNDLAVILFDAGHLDLAIGHALRAVEAAPDDADARENLADLWRAKGEQARADGVAAGAAAPGLEQPGRVLIAADFFFPSVGGVERLMEDLGAALIQRGHEVHVITRPLAERRTREHRGMRIHDADGDFTAALHAAHRELAPQAVIGHAPPDAWPITGLLSLPQPHARIVLVPCINEDGYRTLSHPVIRSGWRTSLFNADVVAYSSLGGWDRRVLGELGADAVFLPNAVDRAAADGSFCDRFGLDPARPLVLHVGNVWPEKNHLAFLRQIRRTPGDWQLALVGARGSHPNVHALYEEVAAEAALDPRVRLLGGQPAGVVAAAMDEADLLVLPSIAEATPLVLLEAMAHGLPWLATPTCGSARDHAGGLLVPFAELPAAIDALLADPQGRAALGAAGEAHWRASYSWGPLGDAYSALCRGARTVAPPARPLAALVATRAAGAALGVAVVDPEAA